MKTIELIDKYIIKQSDDTEYNPPSYIWTDNTGEIVRCKDCKHGEPFMENKIRCGSTFDRQMMCPDDYCSYGARKEKE